MTQKTQFIFTMLVLFNASVVFAQKLERHEWKNRVLIVTAKNAETLQQQIDILKKDLTGLQERKLVVYKVHPNKYAEGINSDKWIPTLSFYAWTKKTEKDFEVVLMGLDGGVKLRQTEPLSLEKLFTLIDGMPMRKQEMKN
jgi:hypothetical protein